MGPLQLGSGQWKQVNSMVKHCSIWEWPSNHLTCPSHAWRASSIDLSNDHQCFPLFLAYNSFYFFRNVSEFNQRNTGYFTGKWGIWNSITGKYLQNKNHKIVLVSKNHYTKAKIMYLHWSSLLLISIPIIHFDLPSSILSYLKLKLRPHFWMGKNFYSCSLSEVRASWQNP